MCQSVVCRIIHLTVCLVLISSINSYGMHTDWSTILSGSDPNGEHLLTRTERSFGGNKIEPPSRPNSYWDDPHYRPYFDNSTERNATAQLGKTAYLNCKIRQLGDRTVGAVSWVRQRDLHILTVGKYTYTSDQRFTSIHLDNSEVWTLEIKYVQKKDAGVYECQVSTEPKMSLSINLNVVVSRAHIPEGPNLYIQSGSTINLTCIITESTSPPVFVFWYHDDRMINYDSSRGGIKVTTENGPTTVSRLRIQNARPSDSGNYSCQPSYADPANITVHVLNGEKPAAMQHGRSSIVVPAPNPLQILLAVFVCCAFRTSTSFVRR
ncbi:lachesin-like isoform X2 [Argiope bruennichi]|uniref:Zwei Ig domain protein zig-8 like protein n=1 Tax=Argiope bruennichi TaxID=94029 RepID=A0A8T0E5L0_ARGBR|nr:lachesin-like isoform X2 [Argiope bruennichi]KAF8764720.1 Zwei Ig domain protein zig-8 like protein [Argiope bruennichi]